MFGQSAFYFGCSETWAGADDAGPDSYLAQPSPSHRQSASCIAGSAGLKGERIPGYMLVVIT